jgi:hypothetical protein
MTWCNINGASVNYERLNMIFEANGFQRSTEDEEIQLGKWFQEDDHGKPSPSFLSSQSLQGGK